MKFAIHTSNRRVPEAKKGVAPTKILLRTNFLLHPPSIISRSATGISVYTIMQLISQDARYYLFSGNLF